MPKTAVLHIGTFKTGTTSIQEWLTGAQNNGGLGEVRYPLWRGDFNHNRLATLYCPYGELPPFLQAYAATDRRFALMRRRYREFLASQLRPARGAIMSGEALSVWLTPLHAARLRADLEAFGFEEFHVVLYVRDPADFYLSGTQQGLRSAPGPPKIADPTTFRYAFMQAADVWEQAFPGCLTVRRYPTAPQNDVVADFAGLLQRFLGVSPPAAVRWSNRSLSAEGMQILQDYREAFWMDNAGLPTWDVKLLERFLRLSTADVPQTTPVLKPHVAAVIRANHHADAVVLNARYGVDLGLSDLPPAPDLPPRQVRRVEDVVESVDPAVVHRLLLRLARTELGRSLERRPLPWRVAARVRRGLARAVRSPD